ncbi:MAG: 50S ribosomal protein L21e [archaeon]
MVQRTGGARRKTRHMFKKDIASRGKINITRALQSFTDGEKVLLSAETAVQKGIYFRRFHGKVGVVQKKRGRCYEVEISDGRLKKTVVVAPDHLKKM